MKCAVDGCEADTTRKCGCGCDTAYCEDCWCKASLVKAYTEDIGRGKIVEAIGKSVASFARTIGKVPPSPVSLAVFGAIIFELGMKGTSAEHDGDPETLRKWIFDFVRAEAGLVVERATETVVEKVKSILDNAGFKVVDVAWDRGPEIEERHKKFAEDAIAEASKPRERDDRS